MKNTIEKLFLNVHSKKDMKPFGQGGLLRALHVITQSILKQMNYLHGEQLTVSICVPKFMSIGMSYTVL